MPPRTNHRAPAIILTAGVLAAAAILIGAVRDSTPPPLYPPQPGDLSRVARTHDDPANPGPTVP